MAPGPERLAKSAGLKNLGIVTFMMGILEYSTRCEKEILTALKTTFEKKNVSSQNLLPPFWVHGRVSCEDEVNGIHTLISCL